jgi:predicted phosphoribosyltransferase
MFRDRNHAARELAGRLVEYKGRKPLVLGIPRGGVVIASILARELEGELDVVLARKLRSPVNPELAMGSVAENGNVHLNASVITALGITTETIEEERQAQLRVIKSRAEAYRCILPKIPMKDRIVIITDDGIATGATMAAAIATARAEAPEKLVVALPVGPAEKIDEMQADVDEMVCLSAPANFQAVGQFYESFYQVEDSEVEQILREFAGTQIE